MNKSCKNCRRFKNSYYKPCFDLDGPGADQQLRIFPKPYSRPCLKEKGWRNKKGKLITDFWIFKK